MPAASATTAAARKVLCVRIVYMLTRRLGRSRGDVDLEAQAAGGGQLAKLDPLRVTGAERRLRIDVRRVAVRPQVPANEGDVHLVTGELPRQLVRDVPPETQLTKLHETGVVHEELLDSVDGLEVVLGQDVRGHGISGLVDSLDVDTGVTDAHLTAAERGRKNSRVGTEPVRRAPELPTNAGSELAREIAV